MTDNETNQEIEASDIATKQTLPENQAEAIEQDDPAETIVWDITFSPSSELLQLGSEPVQLFQALSTLGELKVSIDDAKLPAFSELDPTACYLSWHLTLSSEKSEQQIKAVFEPVEAQCELSVERSILASSDEHDTDAKVNQESSQSPIMKAPSIAVEMDKVQALANVVGELVLTQSMLSHLSEQVPPTLLPKLTEGIAQLDRHARDMQKVIIQMSTLPISTIFDVLPKYVQDLSQASGKKVNVTTSGEQTELDKIVLEGIRTILENLVQSVLEYGLETPEQRQQVGKSETGTLHLNADHQAGHIIIEVSDDGAGLDTPNILQKAIEKGLVSATEKLSPHDIQNLIFEPGFSAADKVSDPLNKMGGSVEVASIAGRGTMFTLRLPLMMRIIDAQTIKVADQYYVLPLTAIIDSFEIDTKDIKPVSGKAELYPFRGDYIPILRLDKLFNLSPTMTGLEQRLLVVVEVQGQKAGLLVDDLLSQQQVVINSLETDYQKVLGFSGATIMGNGTVALILDIVGLMTLYKTPNPLKPYKSDRGSAG